MKRKQRSARPVAAAVFGTLLLMATPADAMVPVIDVAALTQLIQEVLAWIEQLRSMEMQLTQLKQTYASTTGLRGMEQLLRLSPAARNYLPPDWNSLEAALTGGAMGNPVLASAIRTQVAVNAVLSPTDVTRLSARLQALLASEREAVAGSQTLTRLAYAQASDRFGSLETLIDKIGATPDAKAIAELQGRIGAEQAMLANEGVKLAALAQMSVAESAARDQIRREQVVASHGSFANRFQPTPPAP
jgi:type IV secretion system protein VirB5